MDRPKHPEHRDRPQHLDVKESKGVLTLTLDDPATRNSMGAEMAMELSGELQRFDADPDLRVVLLTGRDPAFCSGANVRRMAETNLNRPGGDALDSDPWAELDEAWAKVDDTLADNTQDSGEEMDAVRHLPLQLHRLRKPSIAAVNGPAVGLGMGVALGCDIRLASEQATFSEGFVKMGLIPADGSCWQLPRLIGLGNTLMLQYTGDAITADEAFRMGLVSRVTLHDDLIGDATELARRLAGGSTYSMSLIKRLVQRSMDVDLAESMRLAGPAQAIARRTDDHQEGARAFMEKRPPRFTGR
jgi:enoyl-CoA hydratase/carnithine racemase